ncbi:MAG: non-ribosomal peptide synthetase [Bacteroidota bacterium]
MKTSSAYELFREQCKMHPSKSIFSILQAGQLVPLHNEELLRSISHLAKALSERESRRPIVLLHDKVSSFLIGFLACQAAEKIPVPMFAPKNKRHFSRIDKILSDCQPDMILCDATDSVRIQTELAASLHKAVDVISVPEEVPPASVEWTCSHSEEIAFIQYTSGSTSAPKGVVVTHANLLDNLRLIEQSFHTSEESVFLSWLPFYHDMGLIGNLLHAIHLGCQCVLMPSLAAVQSPIDWIRALAMYRVTHTGGPNFIYDLCVQKITRDELADVDLSCVEVFYNGSEPIRKSTIDRFLKLFEPTGLTANQYYTCYGLAEATLLVAAAPYAPTSGQEVASGQLAEGFHLLIDADEEGREGEICLAGKSVTKGYWNKEDSDHLFVNDEGQKFLRTGDIGCLKDGQLYITGRRKEMIIINGKNYFPYDIEETIGRESKFVQPNGVIVSYVQNEGKELPLIFAEVRKKYIHSDYEHMLHEIVYLVDQLLGIQPHDVCLLSPRRLPRTSSGKLQRLLCRNLYLAGKLSHLASYRKNAKDQKDRQRIELARRIVEQQEVELIEDYLQRLLVQKSKSDTTSIDLSQNLLQLGFDSLKIVDLLNTINDELHLHVDMNKLMEMNQLKDFADYLKNILWLNKSTAGGQEITI